MKNRRKSKRNGGFTLVEVLATVAILVILLAVSTVAVIEHIDSLKIAELDNAAREIFMAAENRAVLLSGAQRLDDLVKTGTKVDSHLNSELVAHYYEEENYYVHITDNNNDLLPYGSVD